MIHFPKKLLLSFMVIALLSGCTSPEPEGGGEEDVLAIDEAAADVAAGETDVPADNEIAAAESDLDFEEGAAAQPAPESKPAEGQDEFSEDFDASPALPPEDTAAPAPVPEAELAAPAPIPEPAPMLEPEPAPPISTVMSKIQDIKYLANQNGGTIVIEADAPITFNTRLNPDTNQFVVEIANAELPTRLKRPYIMKEFSGAFGAINAYQQPGSQTARVVIQIKGEGAGEPTVSAEGNSLVVVPATGVVTQTAKAEPKEPEEKATDEAKVDRDEKMLGARTLNEFLTGQSAYYGRPISLQVKDADIRDVLNFIADESGMNMVISDDVTGRISLKLRKIPWDQALVTVMRAKKLGYLRQGNVIRISSLDLLQQESESARKIIDSQKALVPLRVRVIPVSYAQVEDLVKQVPSFLTKERGSAVADARTSSLIITDTDEVLERVARLVRELDVPPAQVMIEGKIVEAGEEFSESVGINWGSAGVPVNLSQSGGYAGGPVDLTQSLQVTNLGNKTTGVFDLKLNLGTLDFLGDLNATLALAERDSLVHILSSPRIVTMNKEKAKITQQGQQVTILQTVDQNGKITKNVNREPVVLDLTVLPQITSDGAVIMDVQVKREFAGGLLDAETQARAINSRTATTKILVKNAQTAVIGGIYQSDSSEGETGVPGLKNIPVLGWLFKSRTRDRSKNELLIFLTPKILNQKDQIADASSSQ